MTRITVDLVDTVTPLLEERVHSAARRLPHLRYADLRLEVTEAKGAGAENGTPKFLGDDQTLAIGIRVLAGDRMSALHESLSKRHRKCQVVMGEGPPAAEILATARKLKADLIVMATHGRSGPKRLFLGSVAEKVVRGASCPVLTLRAG